MRILRFGGEVASQERDGADRLRGARGVTPTQGTARR
jgi:hypothetical protein